MHDFDPGPVEEPFATLARDYPGDEAYPPALFRSEWGPIFHRGRLDGSAKILMVGQDPGQHESIARRILVGGAGQRVQGELAFESLTHPTFPESSSEGVRRRRTRMSRPLRSRGRS